MDADLMEKVASHLLRQKNKHFPKHKETITKKLRDVDLRATVDRLTKKVPKDVANLLRVTVGGKSKQPFPEESLAKALSVLNELLFKALSELDTVIIECKTFEDKNRGTFDQVMTDIARLGETIADLERMSAEAQENINVKEAEITTVIALLKKETYLYQSILMEDRREMAIRKGDLAVFQFMMELTKCETTSFVQLSKENRTDTSESTRSAVGKPAGAPKICKTSSGFEFNFADVKKQDKLERMMTPGARKAVNEVLGRMQATQAKEASQLLQQSAKAARRQSPADDDDDDDDDDDAGTKGRNTEGKQVTALSALGVKNKEVQPGEEMEPLPTPPVDK